MGFSISIKSSYIDIDAFYPYEGWENNDDEESRILCEKGIDVCPRNEQEVEDLMEEMRDMVNEDSDPIIAAVCGCDAQIEVDDEDIGNPFSDSEKYDLPEPEDLISEVINSKFCYIKVWENDGEWSYESEGKFDVSKLTWNKGEFLYDGNGFEFVGGEGSSSYGAFYKHGERIMVHG